MSPDDFRRVALGMDGAFEGAHMGHPDFRVENRIFATLHPNLECGMVALTPDQQRDAVQDHPATFAPENGAWGRAGCTRVRLASVDEDTLGEAMTLAWQKASAAGRRRPKRSRKPARYIKTLANFAPPATGDEIRASALQFVRKLSGATRPSRANEAAFNRALEDVTEAAHRLIHSLTTSAPPRHREVEAQKAQERTRERCGRGD